MARPLAAFAAPENPLFPVVSTHRSRFNGRTNLWLRWCDPTPFGSRRGRNELYNLGGTGGGVQSSLVVLPTPMRHCHRRPVELLNSYPKALDTSNGLPSFIT
jgi:hypothetical protein